MSDYRLNFAVHHSEAQLTQASDYYPFGGSSRSFQREGFVPNEYLYQGKEQLAGTDWYDFHARNYDPNLGRLTQIMY